MPTDPLVQVDAAPEFQRKLRHLARKYRQIYADIHPVLEQLQQSNWSGDRISGVGREVYKVRVENSDLRRGKSGGYRLIYEVRSPSQVALLTIYAKSEQPDIAATEMEEIVAEFERNRET